MRVRCFWPLLVLFSGCGYVGDPLPPLANIPGRIQDLAATQRGARVIVQFTPPTQTTEGMAIHSPLRFDLRVGTAVSPFSAEAWAERARQISGPALTDGHARYEIPAAEWAGKEVTIAARAIGANEKEGAWSNFVNLTVTPTPETPRNVAAQATADGVRVTWQGGPGQYRVLRRAGDEKTFTPAATVTQPEWLDREAPPGKPYTYLVQRIVPAGGRVAESELSEPVTITPRDTFPPAAPTGVRAVAGTNSIELTWERNAEADLAGYRVYRAKGDGGFEKIADTSQLPAYSDRAVEPGVRYQYQIAAVDQTGNESARSAAIAAAL